MIDLPPDFLYTVAGRAPGGKGALQRQIIDAITPGLADTLARFEINTVDRVAYWAGQVSHESDSFCTTAEYASGAAYEGRGDLGNTEGGDGRRFKGRGLIQLTGRANYVAASAALGLDLMKDPTLAAEPVNALIIACWFWQRHGLNALADLPEDVDPPKIEQITRKVNGGLNGIVQRDEATDRAFKALGIDT